MLAVKRHADYVDHVSHECNVWDMCLKQPPSTKSQYKRHLYLHPLSNGNILTFCRYFLLPPLFQVCILSREQQFNIKEPFVVANGLVWLVSMTHKLVLMLGLYYRINYFKVLKYEVLVATSMVSKASMFTFDCL